MDRDRQSSRYRVPDGLAWVDEPLDDGSGALYLTQVPDGRTVLLEGSARLIWLVAVQGGEVATEVAALVGVSASEIEQDVRRFLSELADRGLLVDSEAPPGSSTAADGDVGGSRDVAADPPPPSRQSRTLTKVRRHVSMRLDQAVALAVRRLGPSLRTPAWDGDPRFALVTVNFSTTRYLKLMLLTLAEQDDLGLLRRIVICDNDSRDAPGPFLKALEADTDRVAVTRNARPASHAEGMRAALRALRRAERGDPSPANILLFCDTDVIFRRPDTLRAIADRFADGDVAFVGELRRHVFPYPEAQASFLAVRRDWAERRATAPWVDHGSPAYWLQRSIWRQGGRGEDFPSNADGYILHRGRSGVAAGRRLLTGYRRGSATDARPHFMGVPGGPAIWADVERHHHGMLEAPDAAAALAIADALASIPDPASANAPHNRGSNR